MDSGASYSLKQRLLLGILAGVALVWVATSAYSYFDARREINELLDAHLAQSASLIVAQLGHELEEIDVEHAPTTDRRARRVAFQIWERGTLLRLHSADAPSSRLSAREEGYSNANLGGKGWRVFSTWDAKAPIPRADRRARRGAPRDCGRDCDESARSAARRVADPGAIRLAHDRPRGQTPRSART